VSIHPDTTIGAVRLTVADLERVRDFYEQVLGLRPLDSSDGVVRLGANGAPLVELVGEPDAPPRGQGTTGLFHLAVLVPSRADLARALRRIAVAGWQLSGASDHLVSEALYLRDPEGNGIEIYRDRPQEEWSYKAGQLEMDSLPLDLESVIAALGEATTDAGGAPTGTRIGHVHLQVADLSAAEAFYRDVLGFDVTVRGYPGAVFLSAGGYHHHIGLNTWASEGGPHPPPGARGMRWFDVLLPGRDELDQAAGRLEAAGVEAERTDEGLVATDPSGNRVRLSARNAIVTSA
jgi:catechol 2,3-dioxygenase